MIQLLADLSRLTFDDNDEDPTVIFEKANFNLMLKLFNLFLTVLTDRSSRSAIELQFLVFRLLFTVADQPTVRSLFAHPHASQVSGHSSSLLQVTQFEEHLVTLFLLSRLFQISDQSHLLRVCFSLQLSSLLSKNTSVHTILHQWSSGVDIWQKNTHFSSKINKKDLCQSTNDQFFGTSCEYFPTDNTNLFRVTVGEQSKMRSAHPDLIELCTDVLCYMTLFWDSGLLCLDWRDICEEYRCVNWMCIVNRPDLEIVEREKNECLMQ